MVSTTDVYTGQQREVGNAGAGKKVDKNARDLCVQGQAAADCGRLARDKIKSEAENEDFGQRRLDGVAGNGAD